MKPFPRNNRVMLGCIRLRLIPTFALVILVCTGCVGHTKQPTEQGQIVPPDQSQSTSAKTTHQDFQIAIMGDPQLFRTIGSENFQMRNDESLKLNRWQVSAIRELGAGNNRFSGTIINGDLTEHGHNHRELSGDYTQFWAYEDFYQEDKLPGELWPGLGNHDYQNNVNDTYENNSALRMVDYLEGVIKKLRNKPQYYVADDLAFSHENDVYVYRGSLSYSWDVGNFRFIQLNNYPSYSTHFRGWHWGEPFWPHSRAVPDRWIYIHSSIDNNWLKTQLDKAVTDSKPVILNMHQTGAEHGKRDELNNLMLGYQNIKAVFVGHLHASLGQCSDNVGTTIGNGVPIYFTGAPMYSTMLYANFSETTGVSVNRYSTKNGKATLLGTANNTCSNI